MSWEYREVKQEVDSDDSEEIGFCPTTTQPDSSEMNPKMIQALITNAVRVKGNTGPHHKVRCQIRHCKIAPNL